MRLETMDFFNDMEDQSSTMAMDIDDVDLLEASRKGVMGEGKLADQYNHSVGTLPRLLPNLRRDSKDCVRGIAIGVATVVVFDKGVEFVGEEN
ncbi:hypothetical protein ACFX13_044058 [Malus domestica]